MARARSRREVMGGAFRRGLTIYRGERETLDADQADGCGFSELRKTIRVNLSNLRQKELCALCVSSVNPHLVHSREVAQRAAPPEAVDADCDDAEAGSEPAAGPASVV